jgi:peptidoglycan-associated lipoprotein
MNGTIWNMVVASLALAGVLVGGCTSSQSTPPPTTAAKIPTWKPPAPTRAVATHDTGTAGFVNIDQRVVDMCKLPEPHFAFDSAALSPEADQVLDSIASCFENGPGKGKSMKLIGHADPRGETMYNFALGQHRAGSVASYLEHKGLPDSRVSSSSRGALDATGTDEATWAQDRRVDILLAQ